VKYMPPRKGNKSKLVYFSPDEWKLVCKNAEKCEMKVGTYIQRMALFGEINVFDFEQLASLQVELTRIGTNINQIAHVINETRSVYKKDIEEVEKLMKKIKNSYDKWMKPLVYYTVGNEQDEE